MQQEEGSALDEVRPFTVYLSTGAHTVVTVMATDAEQAAEFAYQDDLPTICAQCSGWGRDVNLELGDDWEVTEVVPSASTPVTSVSGVPEPREAALGELNEALAELVDPDGYPVSPMAVDRGAAHVRAALTALTVSAETLAASSGFGLPAENQALSWLEALINEDKAACSPDTIEGERDKAWAGGVWCAYDTVLGWIATASAKTSAEPSGVVGDTAALDERALIVAFLRGSGGTVACPDDLTVMADLIERGEHR